MENKDELELVQNLDNNLNVNTEAQVNNQVPENNQELYQPVEPATPAFEGVNENIEPVEVIDNVVPSVEPVEMVEPVAQIETVASAPVVETEVVDIDEGNKKPDVVQEQVITEKEKENKENKAGMTLVIVILLILILVVLFLPQITELLSK